ncbi:MAG: DUF1580 domain-containing protein [Phycisphaeraceae bacterium]|nr:DUF1580 domain-containing protein [Phycisphaeraceae bacterium]
MPTLNVAFDGTTDLITLSDASQRATGRPSTSAVWRWCRRGVLARDGTRIRLEHRRVGGKIFTSSEWLDAFTKALTDADTAYFAAKQTAAEGAAPRAATFDAPKRPRRPRRPMTTGNPDRQRRVERDLREEGL